MLFIYFVAVLFPNYNIAIINFAIVDFAIVSLSFNSTITTQKNVLIKSKVKLQLTFKEGLLQSHNSHTK